MVAIAGIRKVNKKSIKERYNTLKEVKDGKPNSQVVAKKDATQIDKKATIRFPKQKRKEIKQCVFSKTSVIRQLCSFFREKSKNNVI